MELAANPEKLSFPGDGSGAISRFGRYQDLLFMLTLRDIKVRYKQSLMGFLWAILMPILIIGSGLIVMVAFATVSGKPVRKADLFSVAVRAVPWAFFVAAIRFATSSLVMNKELVTKIYFPRVILPIASVLANLFDFAVAASVLALVLFASQIGASVYLLWVPLLLLLLVLLTIGLSITLAAANLFFRDVKYLVEVFLTYGVFFVPVFYSASKLGKWAPAVLLDPVGPILEAFNNAIVLHQSPDLIWLLYSAIWATGGLWISYQLFERAEGLFAERI